MRYGIFGGSFDPPHEGHRHLARSASDSLDLDTVFWVPAQDPPHKNRPGTSFEHRIAMVRLAVAEMPRQAVSEIESGLSSPSYSLNTIRALKTAYGAGHAWHFLIGSDNWSIFPSWHRWEDVLREATMVVYPRKGHPVGSLPPGTIGLDLEEFPGESREIRAELAATGNPETAKVLPEIREYIRAHGLYGIGAHGPT